MNTADTCGINKFVERDIDMLLAEELRVNPTFCKWVLSRFDDVLGAFRDHETYSSTGGVALESRRSASDGGAETRMMIELDRECPGYGFAQHKGYGTPEHQAALSRLGPSVHHRRSFEPIRILYEAATRYLG